MKRSYSAYCQTKRDVYENFSEEGLSKQFIPHFEAGTARRIKVQFAYGDTKWGYVSVTAGWKPSFILMRSITQYGSSDLLTDDDKIVDWKDKR